MRKLVLLGLLFVAPAICPAGDWPGFLGPNRDGVSAEKGLAKSFPEGGPKVHWSFNLKAGYSGPAVQGGKVYIMDRAGETDFLRCIDVEKGEQDWEFSYAAPGRVDHPGQRSTPAVDDKYVYIVGPLGHFHCIDKSTHQPVWKLHLIDDFAGRAPMWSVAQSALLYKDLVILAPQSAEGGGPPRDRQPRSQPGGPATREGPAATPPPPPAASAPASAPAPKYGPAGVAAFEKATGKLKWKSKPIGGMAYVSPYNMELEGVQQVIMTSASSTVGIDSDSGERLWAYTGWQAGNPIPTSVFCGQGRFFLTEGYKGGSAMFKVAKEDGKFAVTELWKTQACGAQIHRPFLLDGYLYAISNSNDRNQGLMCVDMDGKVKWQTDKSPSFERGAPLCADGVLYIMEGNSGILRVVQPSPDGFKELAQAKLLAGRETWAPMAIANGKLFCRDQQKLICVDLTSK